MSRREFPAKIRAAAFERAAGMPPTMADTGERAKPVEVCDDDRGDLDEIFADAPRFVHVERMSGNSWFLSITDRDGFYWQFWFGSKNRRSRVDFTHREGPYPPVTPGCGCVYCDLGVPAYLAPDGTMLHESKTSAVHTCTRPKSPTVGPPTVGLRIGRVEE